MARTSGPTFSMNAVAFLAIVACGLSTFAGCEISFSGFTFTGQTAQTSQQGAVGEEIKHVRVFNQFGDIVVKSAQGGAGWSWDGKVWAKTQEEADRFIGELKLSVDTEGDTKTWLLEMPANSVGLNGVESNLTIKLPESVVVEVNNRHGNVRAAETGGDVTIDNAHGNVDVSQVAGNLTIENAHGNVVANTIAMATIAVRHGNADIQTATGSLAIDSSHGRVNVDSVTGELKFLGSHSMLKATDLSSNAILTNAHGELDGKNIAGNVVTENRHGSTKIETLGSRVRISSERGGVDLDVQNTSFENVTIENRHSGIKVKLPQSSTPNITMNVKHGDAKSEFDNQGSSGQLVELTNRHGNIRVTKSAAAEATAEQTAEAVPADQ